MSRFFNKGLLTLAVIASIFAPPYAEAQQSGSGSQREVTSARIKKITPEEKARVFGTPGDRQRMYSTRFQSAPASIQQRILAERAQIQSGLKKYTVGFTSASEISLHTRAYGLVGLPPLMRRPKRHDAGGALAPPEQVSCLEQTLQAVNSSVDMRDYGIVTPVRYQGSCGSCWAFGVTSALETAVLLANGNFQNQNYESFGLSSEEILSCTGPTDFAFGIQISGDDCGGGLQPSGANYASSHSIVLGSAWPYAGAPQTSQCSVFQNQATPYRARDWGWICDPGSDGLPGELAVLTGITSSCFTPSVTKIKQAIVQHGSVVVAMYAGQAFEDYTGGVYDENDGSHYTSVPEVNHVVQLIGWDDNTQAWLVKNSWGTNWGENGFGWVAYNTNNIGSYAVWLDANQFNSACSFTPPTTSTLKSAVISFDNSQQGKDGNAHYWVYVHDGSVSGQSVATFAYSQDNQGGKDYSQPAQETLSVGNPVTFANLNRDGASLHIDFHAQLGGFHQNSDWKTNIKLSLIFSDGATFTAKTTAPVHFHGDESNPSDHWTGSFSLSPANGTFTVTQATQHQ